MIDFTETLRTLGYRRLVSLESFRQPNFPLVADILVWLVKRFDADYNISGDCGTSEHRVLLIRSVTEFMVIIKMLSFILELEFSCKNAMRNPIQMQSNEGK
jgi:hypothetical protein